MHWGRNGNAGKNPHGRRSFGFTRPAPTRARSLLRLLHDRCQILVDLGKAKPRKRIAVRPFSEPVQKYARGIAVLTERLFGKAVGVD